MSGASTGRSALATADWTCQWSGGSMAGAASSSPRRYSREDTSSTGSFGESMEPIPAAGNKGFRPTVGQRGRQLGDGIHAPGSTQPQTSLPARLTLTYAAAHLSGLASTLTAGPNARGLPYEDQSKS